jgi:hypothetical protein
MREQDTGFGCGVCVVVQEWCVSVLEVSGIGRTVNTWTESNNQFIPNRL